MRVQVKVGQVWQIRDYPTLFYVRSIADGFARMEAENDPSWWYKMGINLNSIYWHLVRDVLPAHVEVQLPEVQT